MSPRSVLPSQIRYCSAGDLFSPQRSAICARCSSDTVTSPRKASTGSMGALCTRKKLSMVAAMRRSTIRSTVVVKYFNKPLFTTQLL